MVKNWTDVRPEIKQLYWTKKMSLEDVRKLMKEKHGFDASSRAYKNKIEEWGWKKYNKLSHSSTAAVAQFKTQDEDPTSSSVMRTRLTGLVNVFENKAGLIRQDRASLMSLRELATRYRLGEPILEHIDMCLENIVERSRNTLDGILASVAPPVNSPTGFASCWKQEPMMLEDAHGTLIPIPLDVVGSWQTFDTVLQSHFSILPGLKKVAKQEYAIEDSVTCRTFSRDFPWSSFSKAGLKINMSMIFHDKSRTSVVCPKCDTISKEEKGVMVECKNLGCQMLFRTVDEEERPVLPSRARSRQQSSPSCVTLFLESITRQDHEDDNPGQFKRVIMRVARALPMNYHQISRLSLGDVQNSIYLQLLGVGEPLNTSSPSVWDSWDPDLRCLPFSPECSARLPGDGTLRPKRLQKVSNSNPLHGEYSYGNGATIVDQSNDKLRTTGIIPNGFGYTLTGIAGLPGSARIIPGISYSPNPHTQGAQDIDFTDPVPSHSYPFEPPGNVGDNSTSINGPEFLSDLDFCCEPSYVGFMGLDHWK